MRTYTPKDDVQKKSFHTDRFYVSPQIPKLKPNKEEQQTIDKLKTKVDIKKSYVEAGKLVVVCSKDDIVSMLQAIKNIGYESLMEMSAIDYLKQKSGFSIFYELLSVSLNSRIRVKTFIKKDESIDSVVPIYKSANWSEREMYDMYGIVVNNHPNFKRILMPQDWHDYPLLKTYPLTGDEEASWYEIDKIFGKEYRDVVGPENRQTAKVDRYDTKNFGRVGHETPYNAPKEQIRKKSSKEYHEDMNMVENILMGNFTKSKTLDKRK